MAEKHKTEWPVLVGRATGILVLLGGILLAASLCNATTPSENAVPNIFDPHSTPAESIRHLSYFVLVITGLIFLVVFILLTYVIVKFRNKTLADGREPAQVYGSTQMDLSGVGNLSPGKSGPRITSGLYDPEIIVARTGIASLHFGTSVGCIT